MKKNFAAILASIIVASSLAMSSCDSGNSDSKETKEDNTVATNITSETEESAAKKEEATTEVDATQNEKVEATEEVEAPEVTETTEMTEAIESTEAAESPDDVEPTESTEPIESTELTEPTEPTEPKEPVYIPTDDSIKTYFDNLDLPSKGDSNSNSDSSNKNPNMFKRLRENTIYLYEPGTNNGAIFPYIGSVAAANVVDYTDLFNEAILYGLVDETGTIVCDPVFSSVEDTKCGVYVCAYMEGGQKHVCLISKMGDYLVDIPYEQYKLLDNELYVFDSATHTVKTYDFQGNVIKESAKLEGDVLEAFLDPSFLGKYCWLGFAFAGETMSGAFSGSVYDLTGNPIGGDTLWYGHGRPSIQQNIRFEVVSDMSFDNRTVIYNPDLGIIYDDLDSDDSITYREFHEINNQYYVIDERLYEDGKDLERVTILDDKGDLVSELEFTTEGGCLGSLWFTTNEIIYENRDMDQLDAYTYSGEFIKSYDWDGWSSGTLAASNEDYFVICNWTGLDPAVYDYDFNLIYNSSGSVIEVDGDLYLANSSLDEFTRCSDGTVTEIDNPNWYTLPIISNGCYMVCFRDESQDFCNVLYNSEGEVVFRYNTIDCSVLEETESVWIIY